MYLAQGFPENYIFSRGANGKALPQSAQVRMVGNSVCPMVAKAIVQANYEDIAFIRDASALQIAA